MIDAPGEGRRAMVGPLEILSPCFLAPARSGAFRRPGVICRSSPNRLPATFHALAGHAITDDVLRQRRTGRRYSSINKRVVAVLKEPFDDTIAALEAPRADASAARAYCGPVFQTRHCLLICGSCVRCSTGTCSGVTAGNCEMMRFGLRANRSLRRRAGALSNGFRIAVICLRRRRRR